MSDIIREIDEDLRREDWEKVWTRYGKFIVAGIVAIVVVTVAIVGWKAWDKSARMKAGERFAEIVAEVESTKEPAAAADILATYAAGAPDGYAVLARLREAKLLADAGDRTAAAVAYDAIAADGGAPDMFRDLAALYSVRMQVGAADPAALVARLDPMTADGKAWRYSAREMKAILLLEAGDVPAAREIYARLADDLDAPRGLRARAAEMLRALGSEAVTPDAAPKAAAPATPAEGAQATQ